MPVTVFPTEWLFRDFSYPCISTPMVSKINIPPLSQVSASGGERLDRYIPPDIIEDIVGHLAKDTASLKACSLVSYLLRPISQKLIFSRIMLNVDTDIERETPSHRRKRYHSLLEVIADNPLIPHYVRVLSIGLCAFMTHSNSLEPWCVPPALDAALCSVVALKSLETLTFYGIQDFPVKHYSQHFTSLKRLGTDDGSLPVHPVAHSPPDALGRASGKVYRLQELSLHTPPTDFPLHARASGLDISQLVRFKFTTFDDCENQVIAAWQVANEASQTLTHLVWKSVLFFSRVPEWRLPLLRALRSVTFHLSEIVNHQVAIPDILDMLYPVSSEAYLSPIEDIALEISLSENHRKQIEGADWNRWDKVLVSPYFENLQHFNLVMNICPPSSYGIRYESHFERISRKSWLTKLYAEKLARLHARGALGLVININDDGENLSLP
ncbi:hypothetical protein B0H34DRAFT_518070 [Crassisporium funariophilum]|nr:hypothetical protein B0H34DRAFT_518070 [Crassisporium funariophilum]